MTNNEKFYTAENVAAVYENIRNRKEHHQVCSYRILIDGKTIVRRTYNLNEFYTYRHSLTSESRTISITIYGRFAPVASYELKRVDSALCRNSCNPNEELAFENIRLFSETLEKDIEIFELRERLAKAELEKASGKIRNGSIEIKDTESALVILVPKSNSLFEIFQGDLEKCREIFQVHQTFKTKKS